MGDVSTEGWVAQPNIGVMNEAATTSDTAKMARQKSEEIMQALRSGEPGAADKMMGKSEPKGTDGIVPLGFLKGKFGRSKKDKKDDNAKSSSPLDATDRTGGNENESGLSDASGKQETGMFVSASRFSRRMKTKEDDKVIR